MVGIFILGVLWQTTQRKHVIWNLLCNNENIHLEQTSLHLPLLTNVKNNANKENMMLTFLCKYKHKHILQILKAFWRITVEINQIHVYGVHNQYDIIVNNVTLNMWKQRFPNWWLLILFYINYLISNGIFFPAPSYRII